MNPIDQLISDFLDGRLDEGQTKELALSLEASPELRREFLELYRAHRLLAHQYSSLPDNVFEGNVMTTLRKQDDEFVARIFKTLQEERKQSVRDGLGRRALNLFERPVWLALAASVALLMTVGWLWAVRSRALPAQITEASAGVTILREGRDLPGQNGMRLREGDVLETDSRGTATVKYLGEETRLVLAAHGRLLFQPARHGKHLALESGEVSVAAAHQPTNAPLIFSTAQAEARVVGTRFLLAARAHSTWLEVSNGEVAMTPLQVAVPDKTAAGKPKGIPVKTGEYAVVASGVPLVARTVTEQHNLATPLPLNLNWFSEYGSKDLEHWYVHPGEVSHAQATSGMRSIRLPNIKGSLLIQTKVFVKEVGRETPTRRGRAGFAFGLDTSAAYQNTPEACFLGCVQRSDGQTALQLLKVGQDLIADVPVNVPLWTQYNMALLIDRDVSDGQALMRGKIWTGSEEPADWQISKEVKLTNLADRLIFVTMNMACDFQDISVSLVD